MSNKWEIEAENPDIAVCAVILYAQTAAPVAIYTPGVSSKFSAIGIDSNGDHVNEFDAFMDDNRNNIHQAIQTIKSL